MRWQPGKGNGDGNQRNENPTAGGIFALAHSKTAASRKAKGDCTGQREYYETNARRMGKESCPIAPTPDDECEKRQRTAEAKSKILNDVSWHNPDNVSGEARSSNHKTQSQTSTPDNPGSGGKLRAYFGRDANWTPGLRIDGTPEGTGLGQELAIAL